jgi:hypothetical protein
MTPAMVCAEHDGQGENAAEHAHGHERAVGCASQKREGAFRKPDNASP